MAKDSKKHGGQQGQDARVPTEPVADEVPQAAQDAPDPEVVEAEVVEEQVCSEIEQYEQQLAEKDEKFLRLAAEYDNFRKRSAKERESAWTEAKCEAAASFLPVYDNLERAIKTGTEDTGFFKGIEMTMAQLKEVFEKLGITEIEALGAKFDPALHDAVMHVDDEQTEENTVIEVFQSGFRCGDKVIRHAIVKVAN